MMRHEPGACAARSETRRILESSGWALLSVVIQIGMQSLCLIKGWGLEPQSWEWILGAGVVGVLFGKLLLEIEPVRPAPGEQSSPIEKQQ